MGAGVSLSLPHNGFSVRHLVSGPFARDLDLFGDTFTKVGLNADSGATFSDLQGFTLRSAVPCRYEQGVRPEVSFIGFGGGHFPPSLSFTCYGLKVSGYADAKSAVADAVSDTADADAVPDSVAVCITVVANQYTDALASDLGDFAPPFSFVGHLSSTSAGAIKVTAEIVDFGVAANNDAAGSSTILRFDPTRSRLDRTEGGVGPVFEGVAVSDGVTDDNDAYIAFSGGLSSDLQSGVIPSSFPVRFGSNVLGVPNYGTSTHVVAFSAVGNKGLIADSVSVGFSPSSVHASEVKITAHTISDVAGTITGPIADAGTSTSDLQFKAAFSGVRYLEDDCFVDAFNDAAISARTGVAVANIGPISDFDTFKDTAASLGLLAGRVAEIMGFRGRILGLTAIVPRLVSGCVHLTGRTD